MASKIKVHPRTIAAAAAMATAALITVAPTASAAAAETPGQQAGDALRSGITQLEQPLVPYIESQFGYPPSWLNTGPYPALPSVTNSSISLTLGGTTGPYLSESGVGLLAYVWNLPQPYALYTPEQLFPLTPQLGSLSLDQSVAQGTSLLNTALLTELAQGNSVTVWTTSQSSTVATEELRLLGTEGNPGVGQLSFILTGDPNNPNGGPFERFPGLYIPLLGITFNGATPSDTPYQVAIYTNQYDGVANFPQYPLNVVSDLNALAGFAWGQHYYAEPRAYIQLPTSPGYTGNTTYYKALDPTLPLLVPVRQYIPAPYGNALADLVQPDLRVIVDMGYGSGEYADIPTPASLVEFPNPFTIVPDLVTGTIQGPTAALVDLGVLPAADFPTTYPYAPVLDPKLNYPLPQSSTTGVSVLTTAEGSLHPGNGQAQPVLSTTVSSTTPVATTPSVTTTTPVRTAVSSVTTAVHQAIPSFITPIRTALTGGNKPVTSEVSKPTTPAVSSVTTAVRTAISSVTTPVRTALTGGRQPGTPGVSKPSTPAANTSTPTVKPAAGHGKKH
jgi:PE-PPE domain